MRPLLGARKKTRAFAAHYRLKNLKPFWVFTDGTFVVFLADGVDTGVKKGHTSAV
jgi:hypothetical protein